jgi:hypothetical protein
MPLSPNQIAENLKDYQDATGGNDGPPEGTFACTIMSGQTHPAQKYSKKGDRPELFFIAQIDEGDKARRTIPATMRWFVANEKQNGDTKTEEELARGEAFVRKMTREFFQAIWGKNFENAPEGILLPAAGDSMEEVEEVFKDIAKVLGGTPVNTTVKYSKDSDFPNVTFRPSTASAFSIG